MPTFEQHKHMFEQAIVYYLLKATFHLLNVLCKFFMNINQFKTGFHLLKNIFHLLKVWCKFFRDINQYSFKRPFHLFKTGFHLLKNIFQLLKVWCKFLGTLFSTHSNGHFICSKLGFTCWKPFFTCWRFNARCF